MLGILEGNICAAVCTYERGARVFGIGWGCRLCWRVWSYSILGRELSPEFPSFWFWVHNMLRRNRRYFVSTTQVWVFCLALSLMYFVNVDSYFMDDLLKENSSSFSTGESSQPSSLSNNWRRSVHSPTLDPLVHLFTEKNSSSFPTSNLLPSPALLATSLPKSSQSPAIENPSTSGGQVWSLPHAYTNEIQAIIEETQLWLALFSRLCNSIDRQVS